jgi:hypothetical protein
LPDAPPERCRLPLLDCILCARKAQDVAQSRNPRPASRACKTRARLFGVSCGSL